MSNTFADSLDSFIADMEQVARLRPHTVRAYRYELQAAALQFPAPLDTLTLSELERWAHRGEAAPSTVGRRIAALSRFFQWARRHDLCEHVSLRPILYQALAAIGYQGLHQSGTTPLRQLGTTSRSFPLCAILSLQDTLAGSRLWLVGAKT